MDFNHGGEFLITGAMDHGCRLYDVPYQKARYNFRGHVDSVNRVKFSKYNSSFFSASSDKTVSRWDIRTGLLVNTFYGHTASVNSLSLAESENDIITCDSSGKVILWDLRMNKLKGEI